MAIDSNDKVHTSYYDTTKSDLKYATNSRAAEDGDNNNDSGGGSRGGDGCFFDTLGY